MFLVSAFWIKLLFLIHPPQKKEDVQKQCTDFQYILHSASSYINILYNQSAIIKIKLLVSVLNSTLLRFHQGFFFFFSPY